MTTDPDLGPTPAWLLKMRQERPALATDDLFGLKEIVTKASQFEAVIGQIKARGGLALRYGFVTGQNAMYEVTVKWPRPISFLERVQGAEDWPPPWIFEQE